MSTSEASDGIAANSLVRAVLALSQRDHKQAALSLSKTLESPSDSGEASIGLRLLGLISIGGGEIEAGCDVLTRSSTLEKEIGDGKGSMHTTHLINLCRHSKGDLRKVTSYYVESLQMLRKQRNIQAQSLCFYSLVELALVSGDLAMASKLLKRCRDLAESHESRPIKAMEQAIASVRASS